MKFLRMLLKINKEEDKESDEDILYELNEVNKYKYLASRTDDPELLREIRDGNNMYLPDLLYLAVRRAEDFFMENGYWSNPKERKFFRIYLTKKWNAIDEEDKFYVEIDGFQAGRLRLEKQLEKSLKKDAVRLSQRLPDEERKMLYEAREKIGFAIPMCDYAP